MAMSRKSWMPTLLKTNENVGAPPKYRMLPRDSEIGTAQIMIDDEASPLHGLVFHFTRVRIIESKSGGAKVSMEYVIDDPASVTDIDAVKLVVPKIWHNIMRVTGVVAE